MATNDIMRIKELLKEKGMSVQDLSEKAGISYTYASEVVRKVKYPSAEKLKDIANAIDVDIRELFVSTKKEEDLTDPAQAMEAINNIVEQYKSNTNG